MSTWFQDLKHAIRILARSPGFALIAVATLALGIGASTAVFSVVHAVLWSRLPFPSPERLAVVWETDAHNHSFEEGVSAPDFTDWKAQSRSFAALTAASESYLNLTESGRQPEQILGAAVSHDFLRMLRVEPVLGRGFAPADDRPGAPGVVLLSDGIWRARYGASPAVLGRAIALDGKPSTVIGVLPAGIDFPDQTQVWTPLEPSLGSIRAFRGVHNLTAYARLAEGVTIERAGSEMDAIAARLAHQYPDDNAGRGVRVQPLRDAIVGDLRPALLVLLGAVVLVTLIGCANVSGLLLARALARSRELSIRRALGASRARLAALLLTESAVLAGAGGLAGLALAAWFSDVLVALCPQTLPLVGGVGLHLPVLAFTLAISIGSGLLAGLAPLLGALRDIGDNLKREDARTTARAGARGALVVGQVALACILVTAAFLFLSSLRSILSVDPGFRAQGLLTAELRLPKATYPEPPRANYYRWPEVLRFYDALLPRLQAIPGVAGASLAANHPLRPGWTSQIEIEGRPQAPGQRDEVYIRPVAADYFRTVGTPVRRGRPIENRDRQTGPDVLVVNEAFVRRYYGAAEPLGRVVSFWGKARRIVGVVGDERFLGPAREAAAAVYPSLWQIPISSVSLVVRRAGDLSPEPLVSAVREAVRAAEPEVALFHVLPAQALLRDSVGSVRFQALLLSLFGSAALLLAALGLYGLLAYSVARRTRELGIRSALGAPREGLVRMVLQEGMARCLLGLAIGAAGALAIPRLLSSLLYGSRGSDLAVVAAVAAILAAVSLAASYVPARRAARVSPMEALRQE